MDRAQYIHKRKGRYMAQTLEAFEEQIEPHLPKELAGEVQSYKGLVRQKLNALAVDAVEILELGDGEINGAAVDLRDALSTTGR